MNIRGSQSKIYQMNSPNIFLSTGLFLVAWIRTSMISLTIVELIFAINEINTKMVIKITVLVGTYISKKLFIQITYLRKRL